MERSKGNLFILSAKRMNGTGEKGKVDGEEREKRRKVGRKGGKGKRKKEKNPRYKSCLGYFLGTLFNILRFTIYMENGKNMGWCDGSVGMLKAHFPVWQCQELAGL